MIYLTELSCGHYVEYFDDYSTHPNLRIICPECRQLQNILRTKVELIEAINETINFMKALAGSVKYR